METNNANELVELKRAIAQLYSNQESLKEGLDAAEINLRAFQKVLNGMADESVLLTTPEKEGEKPRINWETYYSLVEAEITAMAAAAKEAEKFRMQSLAKELIEGGKVKWLKERIMQHIAGEPVDTITMATRMQNAQKFFEMVELEVENAVAGKEFNAEQIEQLHRMISVEEKNAVSEKNMEEAGVAPSSIGHLADNPDDADTVFGGDVENGG